MSHCAGVVVQVLWPAGDHWYVTVATPEPPVSELDEVSVTAPRTFAPGLPIVAAGGGVVDPHVGHRRRRGGVAGVVGRDGAQVVQAVGRARSCSRTRGSSSRRSGRPASTRRSTEATPEPRVVRVRRAGRRCRGRSRPGCPSSRSAFVLSTRRSVTSFVCVFPATSVTKTRRSMIPSAHGRRVEARGVRRRRVGRDRRPAALAGGRPLEADGVHAGAARVGRGRAQVDGAAQVRARVAQRRRRARSGRR